MNVVEYWNDKYILSKKRKYPLTSNYHKTIVMFFSVLRQMKIRKPNSQQGKNTIKKFKQNQYVSCEPTRVMHFIQEK